MEKKLVTFFSAGGVTKGVAEKLAQAVEGELFEIVPKVPYSNADLKWMNPLARCNKEKFGNKDVPVASKVEDMSQYDVIYIGFPIWYYGAPNIINTFVKEYDFTEKKIILFATSGGSDIGKTSDKLKPYLSDGAEIVDAKLFSPNVSVDELKEWAKF